MARRVHYILVQDISHTHIYIYVFIEYTYTYNIFIEYYRYTTSWDDRKVWFLLARYIFGHAFRCKKSWVRPLEISQAVILKIGAVTKGYRMGYDLTNICKPVIRFTYDPWNNVDLLWSTQRKRSNLCNSAHDPITGRASFRPRFGWVHWWYDHFVAGFFFYCDKPNQIFLIIVYHYPGCIYLIYVGVSENVVYP